MDMDIGEVRREVSRVVGVGHALYMLVPTGICRRTGLKKGDRLAMETDGRTVYAARIPFEDLISKRRATKPSVA
jgi:hypothetical protein